MPGNRRTAMKNLRKVIVRKATALVGGRGGGSIDHGLEQPPQGSEREKVVAYMSVAGTAPGHQFPNEVPSKANFVTLGANATITNSSAIKCIQMHNGAQTLTGNRTRMKLMGNFNKHIAPDNVGDVAFGSQYQTNIKRPRLMQRDVISMNNQLRKTICLNHTGVKPYPSNCKSVQTTNSAEAQQIENVKRVASGEMKLAPRQKLKIDASTCISDTINNTGSIRSLKTQLQTNSSLQKASLYPSGWSMGNLNKLEKQTSYTSLKQSPTLRRSGRYKSPANRSTNQHVESSLVRSRNGSIMNSDKLFCLLSSKEKALMKTVQKKKVGTKVLKRDLRADAELDAKLERLIKLANSTKRKRLKKTARKYLHQIKRDRLKSDFSSRHKRSSSSSSMESFNVGGQECCYCSDEEVSEQSGDDNDSVGKLSINSYTTPTSVNQNSKVELECDRIVVCCCNTSTNKRRLRIECCNKSQKSQMQKRGTKDQNFELGSTQSNRNSIRSRLSDGEVQSYNNGSSLPTSRRQSSVSAKDRLELIDRSDRYSKRRSSVRSQEGYNDTDNRVSIQYQNRSKRNSLASSDRKQKELVDDYYSDNDRYDNHTRNSVFNDNSEQPDASEYCQTQCKYPSSWKMSCDPEMVRNNVCCPFKKCPTKEKYSKPKITDTELMFDKSDLRMTNIERISLPPCLNLRCESRKNSISKNNDAFPNNRAFYNVDSRKNSMDRSERRSGYDNGNCKECKCKENTMRRSSNLGSIFNEHDLNAKAFEDTRQIDLYSENNKKDKRSQQICDSFCDFDACLCPVSDFNNIYNYQEQGWDGQFSQQNQRKQKQQQNVDLCSECDECCNCLYTDINGFQSTNTSPRYQNGNDSRKDRLKNVCDLCCDCCECFDCFGDSNDDRGYTKGYKTPRRRSSSKRIDNTPRTPRKTVPNKSKVEPQRPSITSRVPDEIPQRYIDRQNKKKIKTVESTYEKKVPPVSYRKKSPSLPRITAPKKNIEQPKRNNVRKMNEVPPRAKTKVPNKIPRRMSKTKNNVDITQSEQSGYEEKPKITYKPKGPPPKRPRKSIDSTKNNKPFESPRTVDKVQTERCCDPSTCVYKRKTSNYSLSGPNTDYKTSRGSIDSIKGIRKRESTISIKSDSRVRNPNDCDDKTCDRKNSGKILKTGSLRGGTTNFNCKGIPRKCNDVKVIYNSSSKFTKDEKSSNASTINGEKRLQHNKVSPEYNISESGLPTFGNVETGEGNEISLKENISYCKCSDSTEHVDFKLPDNDVKSLGEMSNCSSKNKSEKFYSKRNHGGHNNCPNSIDPDALFKGKNSEHKFYRQTRT